jgi:hypothetical protein
VCVASLVCEFQVTFHDSQIKIIKKTWGEKNVIVYSQGCRGNSTGNHTYSKEVTAKALTSNSNHKSDIQRMHIAL